VCEDVRLPSLILASAERGVIDRLPGGVLDAERLFKLADGLGSGKSGGSFSMTATAGYSVASETPLRDLHAPCVMSVVTLEGAQQRLVAVMLASMRLPGTGGSAPPSANA
jgi:hypothetical protein